MDYLELERARYEDKLLVSYEIPPRIDIKVPTLILQPIVENAVRHGIGRDGKRRVKIKIQELEESYLVEISDKGKGFPKEVLDQLYAGQAIGNSIGLSNVHKRLKNIYGEDAGLHIISGEDGSTVSMEFKKEKGNENL